MADTSNTIGISDDGFTEAAANPASFSVEGISQSNRSIPEIIAADNHIRKRALVSRKCHPLSGLIFHAVPPGTCDR